LHAEGEFVAFETRGKLGMKIVLGLVRLIKLAK